MISPLVRMMWAAIGLLAICVATAAAGGGPAATVIVEGYVFSRQGPVTDGTVRVYADFADLTADRPVAVSKPGEKPGHYVLEMEPGRYYFTARATVAGRPYFSYHGLNPVTVDPPYHWLPFFVVAADPLTTEAGFQGISGQVFYKDQPLSQGIVSVYPADDDQFRGMGLLTNSLDEEGRFFFDLEPGDYVVVARHRRHGSEMGPLRRGDLFCYPAANPITVTADTESIVTVRCYPRDDLADFLDDPALDPRGRREPQRRHASYWRADRLAQGELPAAAATPITLSGRVIGLDGRPQPGLVVTAYPADDVPLFQMHVLRLITPYMTRTDADGRFRLAMPTGTYYLQARQQIGKAPEAGELYGLYEGNANHSVTLTPGPPPAPVTITVEPIMP